MQWAWKVLGILIMSYFCLSILSALCKLYYGYNKPRADIKSDPVKLLVLCIESLIFRMFSKAWTHVIGFICPPIKSQDNNHSNIQHNVHSQNETQQIQIDTLLHVVLAMKVGLFMLFSTNDTNQVIYIQSNC